MRISIENKIGGYGSGVTKTGKIGAGIWI